MPIRIVESSEPLSPAAQEQGQESLLIDSDASRLLAHELLRYCDGAVSGRSFLIAGHRGAGKTTMVSNAHLQALRETVRRPGATRPLVVWLHGPSLFPQDRAPVQQDRAPDPAGGGDGKAAGAGAHNASPVQVVDGDGRQAVTVIVNSAPAPPAVPDAAQRAMQAKPTDTALALEQITLALHRAVARDFASGFQRRVESLMRLVVEGRDRSWVSRVGYSAHISAGELLELAELAASFERELYESPDDSRLREYWRRARALRRGVLFEGAAHNTRGPQGADATQGSLELVALSGVSQAYRRISGKYEMLEAIKDEAQSKSEASFGIDSTTGKLFAPITSLLTGGLVGAGVLAGTDTSGPVATIAGILAALGASLVFRASSSRSRAATASREQKFIFDLSATTLDRILPILIERVRRAGLAPIFVVDELDKVDQLSRRILGMVHHLKKFVAENAFFCFLTDRTYFERLSQRTGTLAYPVEYTYYTHLIFVSFAARDFHEYLSGRPLRGDQPARPGALQLAPEVAATAVDAASQAAARPVAEGLTTKDATADSTDKTTRQGESAPAASEPVEPTPVDPKPSEPALVGSKPADPVAAGAAPAAGTSSETAAATKLANGPETPAASGTPSAPRNPTGEMPAFQAQSTISGDELDLEVLPYFLLHRAQLHPLDLKRQLSALRNPAGNVSMRRGQVRGEGYRLDVQLQVAIEIMLDRELIRAYLTRDPDDRRLVHDAMYYLTRQWKKEEKLIDLSDAGKDAFSTYLSDRIGTEGVLPEPMKRAAPKVPSGDALDTERMVVDDTTRDFLLDAVRTLAEILTDHDLFERSVDSWNSERTAEGRPAVGGGVRDALQLKRSRPLLRRVGAEGSHQYAWNYDRAGLPLTMPPEVAATVEAAGPDATTDIDADIAYIQAFATALQEI